LSAAGDGPANTTTVNTDSEMRSDMNRSSREMELLINL
jgi:hypothetical protein